MQFFLVSDRGAGLGIALRLKQEGHDVTVQIRNRRYAADYDNLIRKSKLTVAPDMIFLFDSPGGGKTAERLRGLGYAVLGGSNFGDQLALDPLMNRGMMDEVEIKQWVEAPAGLTITTGAWFDGVKFLPPFYHIVEADRAMNEDLGAECDAGSCVWACTTPLCGIADKGLRRMEPLLRHHGYRGTLELETLVNEYGVYGLEFSTRLGGDAFPAVMEMMTEGLGETFARLARNERTLTFPLRTSGYAVALRVSIPPYPNPVDAPADVPIAGLVRADRPHTYFYNVRANDQGALVTSGVDGRIADCTAYGEQLCDATAAVEEIARRVEVPYKQFRTDLASVFMQQRDHYQQLTAPPEASDPQSLPLDLVRQ